MSSEKRDYYEILGFSREEKEKVGQDQIKKAYRQLALKYHPDKNPGDKAAEEKFKELTEAYQVLSNEETRARYDRFGHQAFQGGNPFDGFGDMGGFAEEIFGDLFGAFFGTSGRGGRASSRQRSGRDLRYNLTITLEEAAKGAEKRIKIKKPVPCTTCKGTGGKEGSSPKQCAQCAGSGQMRIQQGFFTISRPCSACGARGTVIAEPCETCSGTGSSQVEKELSVQVPAGIDTGLQLKLRGEGEDIGSLGPSGDLYVEITIKPHKIFHRQDSEIVCEVPMSYAQAVLGGEIEVPTLEGNVSLKIPAGTESGKVFRLRGKGILDMRTGRKGDQHVRTFVYVPKQISDREKELLAELLTVEGKAPAAGEGRSFFDKVKEFFE